MMFALQVGCHWNVGFSPFGDVGTEMWTGAFGLCQDIGASKEAVHQVGGVTDLDISDTRLPGMCNPVTCLCC